MISELDYRNELGKGFFGLRVYLANKKHWPKPREKYLSYKVKGSIVTKKVQIDLREQAEEIEAEWIADRDKTKGLLTHSKHNRNRTSIGERFVEQPCPIRSINIQLETYKKNRDKAPVVDWQFTSNGDLLFRTWPPKIIFWRGASTHNYRFVFRNRADYNNQWKTAIDQYCEDIEITEAEKKNLLSMKPAWIDIKEFATAECIRLYNIDPTNINPLLRIS